MPKSGYLQRQAIAGIEFALNAVQNVRCSAAVICVCLLDSPIAAKNV